MASYLSFHQWLSAAPRSQVRALVTKRRDAVRSDTGSQLRFGQVLSSRQAVAIGLESLAAPALAAATRAASFARAHTAAHAEVFSPDPAIRTAVLTELFDLGLVWPAAHAWAAHATQAPAFRIQPEATTLLPTTAAHAQNPPWWMDQPLASPPRVEGLPVAESVRTNAQAAAVNETLSSLHATVRLFATLAPSQLVSGGVGKRDALNCATKLDLDPPLAFFLIELTAALGLLGVGGPDHDPQWLPTAAADAFETTDRAEAYISAVHTWLLSYVDITHVLAGKTPAGHRVHLLSSQNSDAHHSAYAGFPSSRSSTPFMRYRVLTLLAELSWKASAPEDAGGTSNTGTQAAGAQQASAPPLLTRYAVSDATLSAHAQFFHPLVAAMNPRSIAQVLAEAEFLGLVATPLARPHAHALTPLGELIVESLRNHMSADLSPLGYAIDRVEFDTDDRTKISAAITSDLPPLETQVVMQSDLTAIATGPLDPAVSAQLERLARVETRGQGTVFRFSADSLRTAFESGMSAEAILASLEQASATPLPGPLKFLVTDTAAKLRRVHVTHARGAIVVDDPQDLDELIHDPLFMAAKLVRVAPTVALAQVSDERLRSLLEARGTPTLNLATDTRPARAHSSPAPANIQRRSTRLRNVDLDAFTKAVSTPTPRTVNSTREGHADDASEPALALATLREAQATGQAARVVFVSSSGDKRDITLLPRSVAAGRLSAAVGAKGERELNIPVTRIVSAQLVDANTNSTEPNTTTGMTQRSPQ